MMEIIDSHTHWGPFLTLGTEVTTEELLRQAEESGVEGIVIFPFPSTAIEDERVKRGGTLLTMLTYPPCL